MSPVPGASTTRSQLSISSQAFVGTLRAKESRASPSGSNRSSELSFDMSPTVISRDRSTKKLMNPANHQSPWSRNVVI